MENFSYRPLDLSKNEIRLLVLDPSNDSDNISGRIVHSKLPSGSEQGELDDQIVGYEALSYEWGQIPDIQPVVGTPQKKEFALNNIFLDGKQFCVRWNLYCALRQLRLPERHRILWCDAVCIDQTDNRERNHQVTLMGRIYAKAKRVLVWLGFNKSHLANPLRRMKDFTDYSLNERLWFGSDSESLEFKYLSVWEGLPSLSYWSRLWIVQEFVLAQDLVLHLGQATLDLENFHKFCAGIDHIVIRDAWEGMKWLREFRQKTLFQLYRHRIGLQTPDMRDGRELLIPLFDLVCMYGESKCMDLRDRVFGLHSLAPQCCRKSTPVDYSTSLYNTCGKLLTHYLLEHVGAGWKPSGDMDCSGLPKTCQAMQRVLAISRSDCLETPYIQQQSALIRVTGNIVGTVGSDASCLPSGIFKPNVFTTYTDYSHNREFQKRARYALTFKIVNQIWNLSGGCGVHQWAGTGELPTSLRRPDYVVPPLTFHHQPKLLSIPQPAKLSELLQHQEAQREVMGQTLQDRAHLSNIHSLDSCITALLSNGLESSKPFYCTSGMIGHTYGDIKEGDAICAFRGSSIVVALRCMSGTYEISGIGWISFRRVGSGATLGMGNDRSYGIGFHDDSALDYPVHLLFSMQGLMLIAAYRS